MWINANQFKQLMTVMSSIYAKVTELGEENPQRWALMLERTFAKKKDEEGLLLAQSISKRLAKRRTRRKKIREPQDNTL